MPVTNSIPDEDRYVSYEPEEETTNFPVGFVLFTGSAEEARSEIEVKIDGLVLDPEDYTLDGTFDLTTDYPVVTDAEVVLPAGVTGVQVEIEGRKVVERVAQLPNGQGVAPHYLNVILNRIWAILRENRQRLDRVPMLPYGETPPTAEEMLAWLNYVVDPGAVISVNGQTGPVTLGKADVGLGNVPNYPVASQAEAEAGGASDKLMTALRVAEAIAALAPAGSMPPGAIYGLRISNNGSDATNDIDIAAGKARNIGDTVDMTLASGLTKRLDAAWVVGTNQGGMLGGLTKAINTWYAVHLIRRSDTGVIDVGFHTSRDAPTLPTNYTEFRRIGWIRTDGTGAIRAFSQHPRDPESFKWTASILDVSDAGISSNTTQLKTLTVPSACEAIVRLHILDTTAEGYYGYVWTAGGEALDVSDVASAQVLGANSVIGVAEVRVFVSSTGQVQYRVRVSTGQIDNFYIRTIGWRDTRERLEA